MNGLTSSEEYEYDDGNHMVSGYNVHTIGHQTTGGGNMLLVDNNILVHCIILKPTNKPHQDQQIYCEALTRMGAKFIIE